MLTIQSLIHYAKIVDAEANQVENGSVRPPLNRSSMHIIKLRHCTVLGWQAVVSMAIMTKSIDHAELRNFLLLLMAETNG